MTKEKFQVGDIWYAAYAYEEDPSSVKDRPVLIINLMPLASVTLKITSAGKRDEYDYEIMKWREAGLSQKSYIRTRKLLNIEEKAFRRKIGQLHNDDMMCLNLLIASLLRK